MAGEGEGAVRVACRGEVVGRLEGERDRTGKGTGEGWVDVTMSEAELRRSEEGQEG